MGEESETFSQFLTSSTEPLTRGPSMMLQNKEVDIYRYFDYTPVYRTGWPIHFKLKTYAIPGVYIFTAHTYAL